MTPLRARRFARRCKVLREPWPVLHLRDWVRTAFQAPWLGAFFLAGHRLPDLQKAKDLLEQFWERHFFADGQRPRSPRRTIPYYIHGDEGRGQAKRPVEVISFQPVLPWSGEGHTSMEKSLARPIRVGRFFLVEAFFGFCGVRPGTHSVRGWSTRCFERYAPRYESQHTLLRALVQDARLAQSEGVEALCFSIILHCCVLHLTQCQNPLSLCQVEFEGQRPTFYLRFVGCKGDWPYLPWACPLMDGKLGR